MKFVGVGVLCVVAACGDKEASDPTDAPPMPIDAPPAAIDAPEPPDATCFEPWIEDHGLVRVELVHHAEGTTATRATAFVYDDTGAEFLWFDELGCTDVSKHVNTPFANYPSATYHDPGQVLVVGGAQPLQLARQTSAGVDALGITHPANTWFAHDGGASADDGAQYLAPDKLFTAIFAGSASFPGFVYTDALYIPPTLGFSDTDPLAIPSTPTNLTFEFDAPTAPPPTGFYVRNWVMFTGPEGPAVVCSMPQLGAPGPITVPPAMLDLVRSKYPSGGTLVREANVTAERALNDGVDEHVDARGCPVGLAVYFNGANSHESTFTVEP